jgi:S1-C subfamily serine protease
MFFFAMGAGNRANSIHVSGVDSDQTAQSPSITSSYFINLNSIVRIRCGPLLGTAVVVDHNILYTVNHVLFKSQNCTLNGNPLTVIYQNKSLDFAVVSGDTGKIPRIEINCSGFVTSEQYFLIGYAEGTEFAINKGIATEQFGDFIDRPTGQPFDHVRILTGESHHGMSGGPILDSSGRLVGIINAVSIGKISRTYSREMKDTFACEKR